MSAVMDDDDEVCFIYQEDPECQGDTQLKDLSVGDSFIFMGNRFRKTNNYGWYMGVCNIQNDEGDMSHIHPTTRVTLIQ